LRYRARFNAKQVPLFLLTAVTWTQPPALNAAASGLITPNWRRSWQTESSFTRAARLIDLLEEKGIVGPAKTGAQHREVIGYSDGTIEPAKPDADAEHTRRWSAEE